MTDAVRRLLLSQLRMTQEMDHPFKTGCLHCDRGHLHSAKAKELMDEDPDLSDRDVLYEWGKRIEESMMELWADKRYMDVVEEAKRIEAEEAKEQGPKGIEQS